MRMMLRVQLDTEAGNRTIKDGTMPKLIETAVAELKPEAAYFLPTDGKRTMFLFFDLADPSKIPPTVEPFFEGANAQVELTPVMDLQDLQAGLATVMQGR